MPIKEEQKTNKQHAVPQNIMDVEFKLIGELTMRQFVYLIVFSILAYGSFALIPTVLRWVFVLFFVVIGLGLAFVPLQERGLDQWIINFFSAIYAPSQRVWRKELIIPTAFAYQHLDVVKQELITLAPTSSRRKLEEYLEVQGQTQKVDELDIPEEEYARKVREAFAAYPSAEPEPAQQVFVEPVEEEKPLESVPEEKPQVEVKPKEEEEIHEVSVQEGEPTKSATEVQKLTSEPKSEKVVEPAQEEVPKPKVEENPPGEVAKKKVTVSPPTKPKEEKLEIIKPKTVFVEGPGGKGPQIIKSRLGRGFNLSQRRSGEFPLSPLTPDRHTGRRFVNLMPGQGDLVLPLRAQRTSDTSSEQVIEEGINKKAEQLKRLLEQVRQEHKGLAEEKKEKKEPEVPVSPEEGEKPTKVDQGDAEKERLYAELESLRESVKRLTETRMQEPLPAKVQPPIKSIRRVSKVPEAAPEPPKEESEPVSFATIKPLTDKPNIISGVVKTPTGDILENVFLVIKNHKGEPVRALKTNALGQFLITTPLANGEYMVEVDTNKKTRLSFDIISLELKGEVLPPLEISGS